ncbi:MAG: formimidoylglutamase [Deltaproteobacteria bacterium]|nr:formimidoylglutamase [Deltaproteobacteria bacterium]
MQEIFVKGRPGDPRLGEWVIPLAQASDLPKSPRTTIALMGSPDDTGVRLNHGRPGAHQGPDAIRRQLYKLTPPADVNWEAAIQLFDGGNIRLSGDIRKTHENAKRRAQELTARADVMIALGGGHDFAAPHFQGLADGLRDRGGKPPRLGLINVDPHLDVRELEAGNPHSGTPFRELVDSQCLKSSNLTQFGYRRNRNSRAHLDYCRKQKMGLLSFEELRSDKKTVAAQFKQALDRLALRCSHVGVTIDMDSCPDAEGTSAAPVLGFSAAELCAFAEVAGNHKKVCYLELAEVAPPLDTHERSARIAAEVIYAFLVSLSGR